MSRKSENIIYGCITIMVLLVAIFIHPIALILLFMCWAGFSIIGDYYDDGGI